MVLEELKKVQAGLGFSDIGRSSIDIFCMFQGNPGLFNHAVSTTLSFLITCPYTFWLTNATADLLYQKHPQGYQRSKLRTITQKYACIFGHQTHQIIEIQS